mmetsp:Transcript_23349/g.51097  ORF Transcript_23349/g.51097 Transcript_23349/m.51097 type:complete len:146 (+) Transcript_23349:625-1062(+)
MKHRGRRRRRRKHAILEFRFHSCNNCISNNNNISSSTDKKSTTATITFDTMATIIRSQLQLQILLFRGTTDRVERTSSHFELIQICTRLFTLSSYYCVVRNKGTRIGIYQFESYRSPSFQSTPLKAKHKIYCNEVDIMCHESHVT